MADHLTLSPAALADPEKLAVVRRILSPDTVAALLEGAVAHTDGSVSLQLPTDPRQFAEVLELDDRLGLGAVVRLWMRAAEFCADPWEYLNWLVDIGDVVEIDLRGELLRLQRAT